MASTNEIRHSAAVLGGGPGSFLDLPRWSTILSGLDAWPQGDCSEVHDDRLLALLRQTRDAAHVRELRQPPVFDDPKLSRRVPAYIFPGWFTVRLPGRLDQQLGRPLVHFGELDVRGKQGGTRIFRDSDWPEIKAAIASGELKRPPRWPLVPVRFVRACRFGHCDDINWEFLVHGGNPCIGRARMWMKQTGASGELSDLNIHCAECDKRYSLANLKSADRALGNGTAGPLGYCDGTAPWLREANNTPVKLGCGSNGAPEPWRLLVRHATNAYFARTISTLWLPPESTGLSDYVNANWDDEFYDVTTRDILVALARRGKLKADLEANGWTADELWDAIVRRSQGPTATPSRRADPRRPEIERILASGDDIGDFARPSSDFTVRKLPRHLFAPSEDSVTRAIAQVYLGHRIRVTTALRGFTRLEPMMFPVTSEVDLGVEAAPLALPNGKEGGQRVGWLPAIANRGEGFVVQLDTAMVHAWRQRPAVRKHVGRFYDRLVKLSPAFFRPGSNEQQQREELASFMLLHTLSHALLQSVAMECGYSPPSLAERVYNFDDVFAVLLYTTSPDADGTLGGLVEAGRSVGRHVAEALRRAALCSNDPVCATPKDRRPATGIAGERTINGAACHSCLLISESSCERRNNDLLDRALLVPTVADDDLQADAEVAFWPEVPE